MPRTRPTALLALACCTLAAPGPGPSAAPQAPQAVGSITALAEPTTRQVVQRRDDNTGEVTFIGSCAGPIDGFQARSILRPGMPGRALGWTPLVGVAVLQGRFVGVLRQPAGGFYDLQVRPTYAGQVGAAVNVYAVGVGEVFITAGQSNTTNWGSPTGFVPDLRVSSFDDGPGRGADPNYPGAGWRWGVDPQPVVDGSVGGSVWPTMANNLAVVLNVPIGLYSTGYTGTSVEEWLPGQIFTPPGQPTLHLNLFNRLTNAIEYFNGRGGVRAVLWMQGESDFGLTTDPIAYRANLRTVIDRSRQATGVLIKWMVGQTTTPLPLNPAERVGLEQAQAAVVDHVFTFPGPNADSIGLSYRNPSPIGPLHFNATGLVLLGGYWGIYVANVPGFLYVGDLPPD